MTWNLENLFRPTGGVGQQAYDKKISDLVAVITAGGPDLLGVQEVGDPAAFADLLAALGEAGRDCCRSGPTGAVSGSAGPPSMGQAR